MQTSSYTDRERQTDKWIIKHPHRETDQGQGIRKCKTETATQNQTSHIKTHTHRYCKIIFKHKHINKKKKELGRREINADGIYIVEENNGLSPSLSVCVFLLGVSPLCRGCRASVCLCRRHCCQLFLCVTEGAEKEGWEGERAEKRRETEGDIGGMGEI